MSTPNKGIRIAFLAVIAVFAIVTVVTFALMGGGAEDTDPTPDDAALRDSAQTARVDDNVYADPTQGGTTGLEVTSFALDPSSRVIEGSVQNTANDAFVDVQVAFRLMNARGERITTVRDTVPEVAPGETWVFRIPTDAAASSAELADVTGGRRVATGRMDDPTVTPAQAGYDRSADPTPGTVAKPGGN